MVAHFCRRAYRQTPFWLLASLSLLGYIWLRLWFPFAPHALVAPPGDLHRFARPLIAGILYILLLLYLFALFWLAYWKILAGSPERDNSLRLFLSSPIYVLIGSLLFAIPLLTTFPLNSTDIYPYALRGRISSVYAGNPFTQAPTAFPTDPYLPLAGEWADVTSPYGPLWEIVSAGITSIFQTNFYYSLLGFKGIAALAFFWSSLLIWRQCRHLPPHQKTGKILLWAWNPALLFIFAMNGHNDALMILFLLLAWTLLSAERPIMAVILSSWAFLVKPIALLAFPFIALAAWQKQATIKARLRLVLAAAGGVLASSTLAFFPYGSPIPLLRRLLAEGGEGAAFSPAALLILSGQRLEIAGIFKAVSQVSLGLFILIALILFMAAWRGRSLKHSIADTFFAYIATALPFRLWYAAWPFIWLLLDEDNDKNRYRLHAGIWFLATTQLSVFIYGHLWRTIFNHDHFISHIAGIPFVFILPFILAKFSSQLEAKLIRNASET